MADETKDLTRQEQLEQWVEMIKECESRSKEMSIDEWCKQHGLSRNVYFYRKREVVKAGLLPEKNKKKKSKSKKTTKKKKTPVIETVAVDTTVEEPTTIEEPTEETPAPVEEPAKEESAVEEPTPAVKSAVVEKGEEPVVEESPAVVESTPVEEPAIDITIGSAVIHVHEKTSPELLSMVVQTIVPIMKSNEKTPLKDLPELKEFLAKINIANVTIEQSKGTEE